MSNLSRYSSKGPHRGATKRRSEVASYPLRKVLDDAYPKKVESRFGPDFLITMTLVECGHLLSAASDFIGRRFPARRRCRKCAEGKPPDVELATAADTADALGEKRS